VEYVVFWVVSNISEDSAACIFRIEVPDWGSTVLCNVGIHPVNHMEQQLRKP
jgi:hypothetical protein